MSQSLPVSWSSVEATASQTPVQAEKLSNYDLVLQCQT
ncbi:MAG: RNA polymerase subunit sigma, partial [Phormidesmis sp. CAN_BIN44]|nr:RNA polymerase subunit sigma [Phormidesmis sp. CAN_BIN44]